MFEHKHTHTPIIHLITLGGVEAGEETRKPTSAIKVKANTRTYSPKLNNTRARGFRLQSALCVSGRVCVCVCFFCPICRGAWDGILQRNSGIYINDNVLYSINSDRLSTTKHNDGIIIFVFGEHICAEYFVEYDHIAFNSTPVLVCAGIFTLLVSERNFSRTDM